MSKLLRISSNPRVGASESLQPGDAGRAQANPQASELAKRFGTA
jgi:hypothetical protein